MLRLRHSWKRACTKGRTVGVILAVLAVWVAMTWTVSAQETVQRTFSSPQEAMRTLVEALQAGDRRACGPSWARRVKKSSLPGTPCRTRRIESGF